MKGWRGVLRLAAILSPPIINQIITTLTGEAK
jgi:hypothetical protein